MVVHVIDMSLAGDGNPLNPLGIARRQFIRKELDRAQNDSNITSVVIAGGGKNFSAGADLTEFGNMNAASVTGGDDPESVVPLTYLVSIIENFSKPVVAAMTGNALGGGLEVALSCHYRVADPSGNFGLPEVHVGVIPGAGGTQRLPRLVGVSKALDMILTGKPVSASQALKLGLIDHICSTKEGSVLDAARKWAAWAELMPLADRRVGQLTIKEPPKQLQQIFQFAKFQLPAPSKGGKGMHAALRAIEACTQPIEEGMKVEADMFTKTLIGQQGRGLRHGFFAVRKAQKPLVKLAPSQHVLLEKSFSSKSAGVIGAGLMGSGIALVLLQAGFTVYLVDVSKTSLDKGMAFLQGTIHSYVKRKRMTAEKGKQLLASLKPTQRMEDLSSCCLVVEAVIENLTIKQKIFASLDEIVTSPDAILLSNTSTLDIDAMASALKPSRRSNFAGWHFFSPAHIMKLVEIVVGKETSLETVGVLQQLTKRIKKIGVVVGNCDGFVGNRMLIPYSAETCFLLEEGVATVSSVDNAFLKFGIALGPFQMADLAGLDVGYNIKIARGLVNKDGSPGPNRPERYSDISDIMVKDLNRLGQKSQKGWYDYDKMIGKGRKPIPSSDVSEIVRQHAKAPRPRQFSDEEILERVLYPLVNMGFKILEEGIAQQPSDIDVVYLYGYGWPSYRGGPMYWADHEIGLPKLLSKLKEFQIQFPTTDYYAPSKLLQACVAQDLTIEEYYKRGLHKEHAGHSRL